MILNKELWGKFDASKLKKDNPYVHQYMSAVTSFNDKPIYRYKSNLRSQFRQVRVLMENVIHDMNNEEATDILADIVSTLFDHHFGETSFKHKKYMVSEMLEECFYRLSEDAYDEEEEVA